MGIYVSIESDKDANVTEGTVDFRAVKGVMRMSSLSAMGKAFLNNYGSTRDYSILFNSLNNNSSKSFNMFDVSGKNSTPSLSSNFYSDYASLKNGSYGKLAKTWYSKQAAEPAEGKEGTDYSELAETISAAAKSIGGYGSAGSYTAPDTSGSIFDTAS